MTATTVPSGEPRAGAASHEPTDWQSIDWHQAHRNVRRLQVRIVKATRGAEMGEGQSAPASPDSLERAAKRWPSDE